MNFVLSKHVDTLVRRAKAEISKDNISLAWKLLEDAHIFAQPIAVSHLYVHREMAMLAWHQKDIGEFVGQIVRTFLALPSSALRLYPEGNSGRTSMGIFETAPLSKKHSTKIKELERGEAVRKRNGGEIKTHQRQHPLSRK